VLYYLLTPDGFNNIDKVHLKSTMSPPGLYKIFLLKKKYKKNRVLNKLSESVKIMWLTSFLIMKTQK